MSDIEEYQCHQCLEVKLRDQFPKHLRYRKVCKNCRSSNRIEDTYGISPEVFREMSDAQGGRCKICLHKTKLVVDHDHDTGVVRGLLCTQCNTGLGMFADHPVVLERAIVYLMESSLPK